MLLVVQIDLWVRTGQVKSAPGVRHGSTNSEGVEFALHHLIGVPLLGKGQHVTLPLLPDSHLEALHVVQRRELEGRIYRCAALATVPDAGLLSKNAFQLAQCRCDPHN